MSCSSIWVMDEDFRGKKALEFQNAHLSFPIIMTVIYHKYLPKRVRYINDEKAFFILDDSYYEQVHDISLHQELKIAVEDSNSTVDNAVWDFINGTIFFTKDKDFLAENLEKFLESNLSEISDYGEYVLIRFKEMIETIKNLDTKHKAFVFKANSVDSYIENWFEQYNEDEDEYKEVSLRESVPYDASFVFVDNKRILGYTSSRLFFQKEDYYQEQLKKMK